MRRFLGAIVLASSLALLALAPAPAPTTKPSPKPSLTPIALPTPASLNEPSVVIYPFKQSGQMQANTGVAVAKIFAQAFHASPGVRVIEVAQGIKRSAFQTYARSKNADYYITGYLTPIGNGAAVVEQLVSTQSGIIIYSQTSQIFSVQDVASLALRAHDAVVGIAGPENQSVAPSASATPAPSASSGGQVSLNGLSGIVHSLFAHPTKRVATAPTHPALPPMPSRIAIVTRVSGNASPSDLTLATNELMQRLATYFHTVTPLIAVTNASAQASALCGTNRDQSVITGLIKQVRIGGFRPHNRSTFTLDVYACFGAKLYTTTSTNDNLKAAVDATVKRYQKLHPGNS